MCTCACTCTHTHKICFPWLLTQNKLMVRILHKVLNISVILSAPTTTCHIIQTALIKAMQCNAKNSFRPMFSAYQGRNYFMAYINKLKLRFVNPTDQNDKNILYNKVLNNTFTPLKTTNMSGLQKRKKRASLYRRQDYPHNRVLFKKVKLYSGRKQGMVHDQWNPKFS